MTHPGQESINDLSDEELNSKYSQLIRRHQIALRMGMDTAVIYQLELIMNAIEEEKSNRLAMPTDDKTVIIDTELPSSWDEK
jgi:hypothetical protein